ncbi:MAG: ABC transporter ATP-binding protein [Myxococcales bacterium]|nr:ABC transporter ATP-binding protein [Myxococcales bacterium]
MTTTIEVERVTLEFPRSKVYIGPILESLRNMFSGGATTRRDTYVALRDVSLRAGSGDIIGVLGHNGAGKSTLLRLIAGIYRPDQGTVRTAASVLLLAGLSAGFNVQLSGRENIFLYGAILGLSRGEILQLQDESIEFAELADFIDQPLRTYSNGMRSRLGFSIASAVVPDVLLIDETLSAGDAAFREKSAARIKTMISSVHTVLLASHNMNLIRDVCTRAILIDRGQLVAEGEVEQIIAYHLKKAPLPTGPA